MCSNKNTGVPLAVVNSNPLCLALIVDVTVVDVHILKKKFRTTIKEPKIFFPTILNTQHNQSSLCLVRTEESDYFFNVF